jgi:hypothetical protein
MSIQFVPGQVAVGDPSPTGPTVLSGPAKYKLTKIVKLSSANFGTTAVNTLVAALPADSMITGMAIWVKTQLAGNSISAATINVGSSSGGTQYVSAYNTFGTAGAFSVITPITGIMQNYQVPLTGDLQIYVGGTATTGNPTSGEIYFIIEYVR